MNHAVFLISSTKIKQKAFFCILLSNVRVDECCVERINVFSVALYKCVNEIKAYYKMTSVVLYIAFEVSGR